MKYCFSDRIVLFPLFYRVNWLIYNFLQRDATTRSLHAGSQSCNLSSKGSLHVASKDEPAPSRTLEAGLQTVSESVNEETRQHSSGMALGPSGKNSFNIQSSQASLNVPGNVTSARISAADDVEEIIPLQAGDSEICLEIPQMVVTANDASHEETQDDTMQALTNDFQYSDGSLRKDKKSDETNVNVLVNSSLSPSLGAVQIMRPLAGVAWTKNSTGSGATRRSSLNSFLRLSSKMEPSGSKSAPSSPVSERSTEFKNKSVQ